MCPSGPQAGCCVAHTGVLHIARCGHGAHTDDCRLAGSEQRHRGCPSCQAARAGISAAGTGAQGARAQGQRAKECPGGRGAPCQCPSLGMQGTRCAAGAGCGAAGNGGRAGGGGGVGWGGLRLRRKTRGHACAPAAACAPLVHRPQAPRPPSRPGQLPPCKRRRHLELTCRLPPGLISCCTRSMLLAMPSSTSRERGAAAKQNRPSTSSSPREPAQRCGHGRCMQPQPCMLMERQGAFAAVRAQAVHAALASRAHRRVGRAQQGCCPARRQPQPGGAAEPRHQQGLAGTNLGPPMSGASTAPGPAPTHQSAGSRAHRG